MINYIKSEWFRVKNNKLILLFLALDIILFLYLFSKTEILPSAGKIFMMINLFIISCTFVLSLGEILEKGIIRYYLEYIPNRFKFFNLFLLKYICLLFLICILFTVLKSNQVIEQLFISFIFSLLYLIVNAIVVINVGKAGVGLLFSIIGLWILPDLANYLFSKTNIFDIQLAYYLSPNTFQSITSIFNIVIPICYILLFYIISIYQFNRKEF